MRQGCPLSPLLSHIVLECLSKTIREQEEIKIIQIGKKEVKLSLFADDMIIFCTYRTLKTTPEKVLDIINTFSTVAGYKINTQKSVAFLYTNNEQPEKESSKTMPFEIASKNKIPRNKFNKGSERALQ
jgi:hypothetical protein